MLRFFASCLPDTRTLDVIISDGDVTALAKRTQNSDINDKSLKLLYKTILRCREESYYRVCPIFCFLLQQRIRLDICETHMSRSTPIIFSILDPTYYNESLVKLIFTYLPNIDIFSTWPSPQYFRSLGLHNLGKRHAVYNAEHAGLQFKSRGQYAQAIEQFGIARQLLTEFSAEERLKLANQPAGATLANRTHKAIIDCYTQRSLELHEIILECQQQSHANGMHYGCSR